MGQRVFNKKVTKIVGGTGVRLVILRDTINSM